MSSRIELPLVLKSSITEKVFSIFVAMIFLMAVVLLWIIFKWIVGVVSLFALVIGLVFSASAFSQIYCDENGISYIRSVFITDKCSWSEISEVTTDFVSPFAQGFRKSDTMLIHSKKTDIRIAISCFMKEDLSTFVELMEQQAPTAIIDEFTKKLKL